jgi:hypothetical protein
VLEGKSTEMTPISAGSTDLESFGAAYKLAFADNGKNQDACEGATVTVKAVAAP